MPIVASKLLQSILTLALLHSRVKIPDFGAVSEHVLFLVFFLDLIVPEPKRLWLRQSGVSRSVSVRPVLAVRRAPVCGEIRTTPFVGPCFVIK